MDILDKWHEFFNNIQMDYLSIPTIHCEKVIEWQDKKICPAAKKHLVFHIFSISSGVVYAEYEFSFTLCIGYRYRDSPIREKLQKSNQH